MARVVITGATGTIGSELCRALIARGDEPVALTREAARAGGRLPAGTTIHAWPDPERTEPPAAALAGAAAVVNLAGETIGQRWTPAAKARIRDSRVRVTEMLVAGLRRLEPAQTRPAVLVSQSATGYYGAADERLLDESAPAGADFLARVCVDWEAAAAAAADFTRVVCTRTGVVLSAQAGALAQMLPLYRLGLGGPIAGGAQYVPWIGSGDSVSGLLYCVDHPELSGPVNLTAPAPVTGAELAKTLGRVLRRPALVPVPGLAVRALYGEMAQLVIDGQRAVPRRLLLAGFKFRRTDLEAALRELLR